MNVPRHAMVLAAGFGKRMLPLTATCPKPLVEVAGQPLIAHGQARLAAAGVTTMVVNVHHLADQLITWAGAQNPPPHIVIADERAALLETGGGVAAALPLLGNFPFFVLNSDSFWTDRGTPALARLTTAWNDGDMDCLLLLSDVRRATGYDGTGDFLIDSKGRLARARGQGPAFAYMGAYLVHPRLFVDHPGGAFSMNVLWDRAIAAGRLYGLVHQGWWLHVGTPDAISAAERALATQDS